MKFSDYMKEEIKNVSDKLLLEAADRSLDPASSASSTIIIMEEKTIMRKIKKFTTAAACVVFAVVVVIAFVLIQGSLDTDPYDSEHIPGESDTALDTDNETENKFLSYEKISEEELEARKKYGYINAVDIFRKDGYDNFAFWFPKATNGNSGFSTDDIVFYDVTYMTEEPISIFMDSVSNGPFATTDVFNNYHIVFRLVDEYATEKNGGMPVIILMIKGNPENAGFYSYSMATRKITKLCEYDNMLNDPNSVGIYGDRIYYTYTDGDKGDVLCSMKFDGSDKKTFNNDSEMAIYMLTANDEYVFFQNASSGMIYRSDTNFENTVEFANSLSATGHIYNDYLYYLDDRDNVDEVDGQKVITGNLVRKPVTASLSDEDEIIYKSPYNYFIRDGKMYTRKYSPTYYGGWLAYAQNTILEVDLDTLKERTILEYTERDDVIMRMETLVGNVIMLMFEEYNDGQIVTEGMYAKRYYAHYNMDTGVLTEVAFPQA